MLSDVDIKKFIKSGDIKIDPLNLGNIKAASYTFTLNNKLFIPQKQDLIDSANMNIGYRELEITKNGYIINPGDFLLGQTREKVSISQKIACIHDARTTLARIGLNVLQGSILIQPGQSESFETLEISNISQNPIKIYPGMNIVKGIFFLLNKPSQQNYSKTGKYKGQTKANAIIG